MHKVGAVGRRWGQVSMSDETGVPEFGDGIYTYAQAAAILGRGEDSVKSSRVRSWIRTGLAPPSFQLDRWGILSFHDLVSLEVVRRLRAEGVSLQKVRQLEAKLRDDYPERARPFAYEVFFTDGATIWLQVRDEGDPYLVEAVGRRPDHIVWDGAIASFATEIRFDKEDKRALSWSPSKWVDIDPLVQFGSPVVKGTRIPVRTIEANLRAGNPKEVADWYGLRVAQVVGIRDYLAVSS